MNVPNDMDDNSIVVLIKHKGKVWTKGEHYNPNNYDDVMTSVKRITRMLGRTVYVAIFKKDPYDRSTLEEWGFKDYERDSRND